MTCAPHSRGGKPPREHENRCRLARGRCFVATTRRGSTRTPCAGSSPIPLATALGRGSRPAGGGTALAPRALANACARPDSFPPRAGTADSRGPAARGGARGHAGLNRNSRPPLLDHDRARRLAVVDVALLLSDHGRRGLAVDIAACLLSLDYDRVVGPGAMYPHGCVAPAANRKAPALRALANRRAACAAGFAAKRTLAAPRLARHRPAAFRAARSSALTITRAASLTCARAR